VKNEEFVGLTCSKSLYMSKSNLLSIILFLFSFQLIGQSLVFIPKEIQADGQLLESSWDNVQSMSGFYNFFPINDGLAKFDTEVKMYHDGKYLNIAMVYHDSLAENRVNSLKRDNYGAGFHLSDCVGVIIDPYNNQNRGYFFAINAEGTQLDALIANYDNENLGWDAIWESGNTNSNTDKVYEFKIPLSTFSYEADINQWSFQFYTRDAKDRMYTVWNKFERGFLQFDTRFLKPILVEDLIPSKTAKTTIIPALTAGFQKDLISEDNTNFLRPSLDVQQKISAGLRLDLTLNPDFSQVEVDQQVTNLSRFNIVFPERRNFFLENSDMFTTLGLANNINPFNSRFIGANQNILLGIKLSGNVSPSTRIGLLNIQSEKGNVQEAQNYTVASIKQQFNDVFNATGYLVNRQTTEKFSFVNDFNRVGGLKMNYLSKNRKWSGFTSYSHSFNDNINGEAGAFTIENNYNTRTLAFSTKVNTVGKNYLTDIGFVPRLNNFDALTATIFKEGYTEIYQSISFNKFPENQNCIQSIRPLRAELNTFFDEDLNRFETNIFANSAMFFANQMSVYINGYFDDLKLKYAFDPLRNDKLILPGRYRNASVRVGYNSDYTRDVFGSINFQAGSFFEGNRIRFESNLGYRFLPILTLELNYEYNQLQFDELGNQGLHLLGFTKEIFFNNKLNWTTYVQYNQQADNLNINSRLQWEYKPLSFIYFVYSDNYSEFLGHKDWGISLKINRRLNF